VTLQGGLGPGLSLDRQLSVTVLQSQVLVPAATTEQKGALKTIQNLRILKKVQVK
jgi:hypothetical protein